MTRQSILTPLLAAGCLAWCASQAGAATIQVPQQYDIITSAVQAASPGDTILITNSATYQQEVTIDRPVLIMAAPGMTPTIQGSGNAGYVVRTVDGAEGAQFGSEAGGRITINCTGYAVAPTGDYRVVRPEHKGLTPVVFEHLLINNAGTQRTWPFYPYRNTVANGGDWVAGGAFQAGSSTLRNVEIDMNGVADHAIRLHYAGNGAVLRLEGVKLSNILRYAFWISEGTNVNLELDRCEFYGTQHVFYSVPSATCQPTVVVERSYLRSTVTAATAGIVANLAGASTSSNYTFRDSVLFSVNRRAITANAANLALTVDHCDLYANLAEGANFDAGNRTVSITNSNIYSVASGGILNNGDPGTVTSNYNNVYAPAGAAYAGNVAAGANDVVPGQDPGYTDIANADATYSNAFLKTAGQGGTAIGTNRSFVGIVPVELSTFSLN